MPTYNEYGSTGYWVTPSAYFHNEGYISVLYADSPPYERLGITAHPTDWLEATYRYTNLRDVLFGGSLGLLDKSFDAKIRLLKESSNLPAVAFGIRDVGGTGLFSSEYFVATKTFNSFNASLGIGWGFMGTYNSFSNPLNLFADRFYTGKRGDIDFGGTGGKFGLDYWFTGDAALFGGVEYFIPNFNGVKFKIEYDSDEYKGSGNSPKIKDSPINFGFSIPINNYFNVSTYYLRGNTFAFGFNININARDRKKTKDRLVIEKPKIDKKYDFYRSILRNLNRNNLYLQTANLEDNELKVSFAQNKYLDHTLAADGVLEILAEISPDEVNIIEVTEINGPNALSKVTAYKEHIQSINSGFHSSSYLEYINFSSGDENFKEYEFRPKISWPIFNWNLGLNLRTHIGQPTYFFNYSTEVGVKANLQLNRSINLALSYKKPLNDSFDRLLQNPDSIIERVRSDIDSYLIETSKNGYIESLQMNYINEIYRDLYFRYSAGMFELMFGGHGGELLWRPFNKNFGIGFTNYHVKQRAYDGSLNYLDGETFQGRKPYSTHTGHTTFYYYFEPLAMTTKLSYGKYLAGDEGFTFDFSRQTKSGITFGFFWTLTNIPYEVFGEGSFDKGFYFQVPLHLFSEKFNSDIFNWGVRPLSRDGGQQLNDAAQLWGITYFGSHYHYEKNKRNFIK